MVHHTHQCSRLFIQSIDWFESNYHGLYFRLALVSLSDLVSSCIDLGPFRIGSKIVHSSRSLHHIKWDHKQSDEVFKVKAQKNIGASRTLIMSQGFILEAVTWSEISLTAVTAGEKCNLQYFERLETLLLNLRGHVMLGSFMLTLVFVQNITWLSVMARGVRLFLSVCLLALAHRDLFCLPDGKFT